MAVFCVTTNDYGSRLDEHALIGGVVVSVPITVTLTIFLLRNLLHHDLAPERRLLNWLRWLTCVPLGLGCFSFSEWIRFGGPDLIPAILAFIIAALWHASIIYRKRHQLTH